MTSLSDKALRGPRHSADRAEAKREGLMFSFFRNAETLQTRMDLKGVDLRKNLDVANDNRSHWRGKKAGSWKGECIMEAVFHVPAKKKRGAADANCPSHKSPCDSCEPRKKKEGL